MKRVLGLLIAAAIAAARVAQIVVDGTKDAAYGGPALVLIGTDGVNPSTAVQTVQTQFGDNETEWDAGYAKIDGGKLCLMLTGNLQTNFNKLEIFIDSKAGGQSVFDSAGNDSAERMDGLVFDAGFTADYHIIARRGSSKLDLDFANLGAQTFNFYENVFGGTDSGSGNTGTGVNASPIGVAYDGSNAAGVTGGDQAADQMAAAAVNTGLELCIALSDLGYAGGPINVMVGQNGDGHHFWSNQFLGGLPAPQGNLGGDEAGNFTMEGAIDMTHFAGNQYFTLVPEPASAAL